MIRELIIGFVDHEALVNRKLLVRKPLDKAVVEDAMREVGEILSNGNYSVDGYAFINYGNCLSCPAPVLNRKAIELIERLVQKTGCDVADYELGLTMTPDELRRHCDLMLDLRRCR